MRINNIEPTNFGAKARIRGIDNQKHPYLYNEIIALTKEYKIPATFKTHEIELPSVSNDVMKKLNELKIKFFSGKKHQ